MVFIHMLGYNVMHKTCWFDSLHWVIRTAQCTVRLNAVHVVPTRIMQLLEWDLLLFLLIVTLILTWFFNDMPTMKEMLLLH